jgi:hypothetical protein
VQVFTNPFNEQKLKKSAHLILNVSFSLQLIILLCAELAKERTHKAAKKV